MPTVKFRFAERSDKRLTGIYIARGEETLGPYDLPEATALLRSGFLRPDDFAARNGDAAWVALAAMLPPEISANPDAPVERMDARRRDIDLGTVHEPENAPKTAGAKVETAPAVEIAQHAHPHRWRHLSAAFGAITVLALVTIGSARWWESRPTVIGSLAPHNAPAAPIVPAASRPIPTLETVALAPVDLLADVTPEEIGAASVENISSAPTLRGTIDIPANNLGPIPVAGLHVGLYALTEVESVLAPARLAAQAARARLDAQIERAKADFARRSAEERDALQAWRASSPNDSARSSLRYAYTYATGLARTAEKDLRFLLEERATAAGGAMFIQTLPTPIAGAETDAHGAFAMSLPADGGPVAIAVTTRQANDESGAVPRYWLIKLTGRQRTGLDPVQLADSNSTASGDAASLVQTAD